MGPVLSVAAQVMLTVIPIVAIVTGSVIIFFFLLWRHKQRMKLIERGVQPPEVDLKSFSLLAGLITAGVGFVLSVFFVVKDGATYTLLGGLIPLAVGFSLLAYYVLRDHDPNR
jgi:hypothetical protein